MFRGYRVQFIWRQPLGIIEKKTAVACFGMLIIVTVHQQITVISVCPLRAPSICGKKNLNASVFGLIPSETHSVVSTISGRKLQIIYIDPTADGNMSDPLDQK